MHCATIVQNLLIDALAGLLVLTKVVVNTKMSTEVLSTESDFSVVT